MIKVSWTCDMKKYQNQTFSNSQAALSIISDSAHTVVRDPIFLPKIIKSRINTALAKKNDNKYLKD